MKRTYHWWLLSLLLLPGMLVPIWLGPYAPLYDYAGHLLEAQVVTYYNDPQYGYADSYDIRPGWYWQSNALSTLLLIGLGYALPMTLAGQLVLSLYVVLFVGGLALLLRSTSNHWPLLLLAPVLAYNFAFTSGWLNFSYGAALALYALVVYLRWQQQNRTYLLLLLGILLVLIYVAHILVWLLSLVTIAALMAPEPWQWRRHGALLLALSGVVPLLAIARPALAVAAAAIAPAIWCSATIIHRLNLAPRALHWVAFGSLLVVAGIVALLNTILEPFYRAILPNIRHYWVYKATFPLRTFTLPHQFMPPNALLIAFNFLVLVLMFALAALAFWSTKNAEDQNRSRWLAAIYLLCIVYLVIPSGTPDILVTEPRVLLFLAFAAIAAARLTSWRTAVGRVWVVCAVSLYMGSIGVTAGYTRTYAAQTASWQAQMKVLLPARKVLVIRQPTNLEYPTPFLSEAFNSFYNGGYFVATYAIEHGGLISNIWNNGPVRPKQRYPIPWYRSGFDVIQYLAETCPSLRESYDAAIIWGKSSRELTQQLDACFGHRVELPNMIIWKKQGPVGRGDASPGNGVIISNSW